MLIDFKKFEYWIRNGCAILSIFILEDDVMQAQNMRKLLEQICAQQQIQYDFIEATSKADEIISKIIHCTYTPIYFLDLEIKGEERKGLTVAQEIRKVDTKGIIVFVTTHSELAPISYQYMVSALTFIDKALPSEVKYEAIEACMAHYVKLNQLKGEEDVLFVENAHTSFKVPFQSVEYIMTDDPHRLSLVTTNQLVQFYGTLKEIEELEPRLIRCHKSYLVNQHHVQAIDHKLQMLQLKSGKKIPVSRRLMKQMKQLLKGDGII